VKLPLIVSSKLISALHKKRPGIQSVYSDPKPNSPSGISVGSRIVPLLDSTIRTSAQSATKFRFSKFSPSEFGMEDVPVVVNQSTLTPYEMTFYKFRRR
jgi:hypothetical protein